LDLNDGYLINDRAPEISARDRRPDLGDVVKGCGMQYDLETLELSGKVGMQDRIARCSRHRIDDRKLIDAVAEIVQHPHGVAQDCLGVEVGVFPILNGAVRRHQIAQIQRQGWMAISVRVTLIWYFLVLEK